MPHVQVSAQDLRTVLHFCRLTTPLWTGSRQEEKGVTVKPAIQIAFVAQPEFEGSVHNFIPLVIASVHGDSSWLSGVERGAEVLGRFTGTLLLLVIIGIAVTVHTIRSRRERNEPRDTRANDE
jgi:hypothetical protein